MIRQKKSTAVRSLPRCLDYFFLPFPPLSLPLAAFAIIAATMQPTRTTPEIMNRGIGIDVPVAGLRAIIILSIKISPLYYFFFIATITRATITPIITTPAAIPTIMRVESLEPRSAFTEGDEGAAAVVSAGAPAVVSSTVVSAAVVWDAEAAVVVAAEVVVVVSAEVVVVVSSVSSEAVSAVVSSVVSGAEVVTEASSS